MSGTIRTAALPLLTAVLLAGCAGNSEWRAVRDQVLPQLVEGNMNRRLPLMVHTEITRDLGLGYVIDHKTSYNFIMQHNLSEWDIDAETLHSAALENLEKMAKQTEITFADAEESATGQYAIIETGNGYDATHLLSETVRQRVREQLGDGYIAAVPMRDFLIFWHPDFPLGGDFMVEVENQYEAADPKYRLTPRLFLVTDEGLQPLTKQSVGTPEE